MNYLYKFLPAIQDITDNVLNQLCFLSSEINKTHSICDACNSIYCLLLCENLSNKQEDAMN